MIDEFEKLITDFKKIYREKSNKQTIFEISGFPYWENVASNVLAFYFNPTKEHKLDDLLIRSLLQSFDTKIAIGNLDNTQVYREFTTINGGRLDILIVNENFIIGIENKINANIYNDLADYSNTIEKIAQENGISKDKIYKIVLSVKLEKPESSFINVTYSIFFKYIKNNITNFIFNSDSKHLSFLFDFIITFEKPNLMDNNIEIVEFFENNSAEIDKLITNYHELSNSLFQVFRNNININEIQEIKKGSNFKIKYRNLTSSWGVYRDDIIYKGYTFNLQFAFSPTKGLSDLYIWSSEDDVHKLIKNLGYNEFQHFKPSHMQLAGITTNKMIKNVLEQIDLLKQLKEYV